jgi:acetyl esterase
MVVFAPDADAELTLGVSGFPLEEGVRTMNAALEAAGLVPIFSDDDDPTSGEQARYRAVEGRNRFYPPHFFDVAAVRDDIIVAPWGDIRIRVQEPIGPSDATMVYFHGGGWIVGDLDSHKGEASLIANRANTWVIQVDYRLAPEAPFPAGVDDAIFATEWVAENIDRFGGNLAKLSVGGGSAGGNLAAIVAVHCRDKGIPLAAQFLIYPATRLRGQGGVEKQYLGEALNQAGTNWKISPEVADLTGVAPAVIGIGEHDFLLEDTVVFAKKLEQAGVHVILRQYPTLNHGFFAYGPVTPVAEEASIEMSQDLSQLVHG